LASGAFSSFESQSRTYTECSSKGSCDSDTGECECLPGYTGSACQRQECPNDCSGHGRCVSSSVSDDGYGKTNFNSATWDSGKTRECACDRGWQGISCDARICPVGIDPLTCGTDTKHETWQIAVSTDSSTATASGVQYVMSLTFTDQFNGVYTTAPIRVYGEQCDDASTANSWKEQGTSGDAYAHGSLDSSNSIELTNQKSHARKLASCDANRIKAAIQDLPNFAVPDVTVEYQSANTWTVEFVSAANEGQAISMSATVGSSDTDNAAVSPRMEVGTGPWSDGTIDVAVTKHNPRDLDAVTCSNRGSCDSATGICTCFPGYAGLSCNTQTIFF